MSLALLGSPLQPTAPLVNSTPSSNSATFPDSSSSLAPPKLSRDGSSRSRDKISRGQSSPLLSASQALLQSTEAYCLEPKPPLRLSSSSTNVKGLDELAAFWNDDHGASLHYSSIRSGSLREESAKFTLLHNMPNHPSIIPSSTVPSNLSSIISPTRVPQPQDVSQNSMFVSHHRAKSEASVFLTFANPAVDILPEPSSKGPDQDNIPPKDDQLQLDSVKNGNVRSDDGSVKENQEEIQVEQVATDMLVSGISDQQSCPTHTCLSQMLDNSINANDEHQNTSRDETNFVVQVDESSTNGLSHLDQHASKHSETHSHINTQTNTSSQLVKNSISPTKTSTTLVATLSTSCEVDSHKNQDKNAPPNSTPGYVQDGFLNILNLQSVEKLQNNLLQTSNNNDISVISPRHRAISASASTPDCYTRQGSSGRSDVPSTPSRSSLHLSGLFDRNSALDLHSPNPTIRADYRSFLKSGSVDAPIGGLQSQLLKHSHIGNLSPVYSDDAEKNVIDDDDDESPLFSIEDWKRATPIPGGYDIDSIPGIPIKKNLTLKELELQHGPIIKAQMATVTTYDDRKEFGPRKTTTPGDSPNFQRSQQQQINSKKYARCGDAEDLYYPSANTREASIARSLWSNTKGSDYEMDLKNSVSSNIDNISRQSSDKSARDSASNSTTQVHPLKEETSKDQRPPRLLRKKSSGSLDGFSSPSDSGSENEDEDMIPRSLDDTGSILNRKLHRRPNRLYRSSSTQSRSHQSQSPVSVRSQHRSTNESSPSDRSPLKASDRIEKRSSPERNHSIYSELHLSEEEEEQDDDADEDDVSLLLRLERIAARRESNSRSPYDTMSNNDSNHRENDLENVLDAPPKIIVSASPRHIPIEGELELPGVFNSLSFYPTPSKDTSRHRRHPSQSKLERRIREIERRLDMLEKYHRPNEPENVNLRTSMVYGPIENLIQNSNHTQNSHHTNQTPNAPYVPSKTSYSPNDHVYNRRFQEIVQLSGPIKYIQMAALGRDFVQLAEVYGRIIISERCLAPEQKSIKPAALGGQAGGSKFMVQGILFKYAMDVKIATANGREKWLYGGHHRDDAAAMKAASNELLGLSSFIKCSNNAIRFPLMALIDYCGYRLVAVSTLPINHHTIVYGSADAGHTVHNKDKYVQAAMQEFGHDLNLREHLVFNTPIMGPGDLEVHHGLDGFFYMIDFSRVFPAEAPLEHANPQSIFYKLLRPELVRSNPKPLSSDAFSGWQSSDSQSESMNNDVIDATRRLFEEVLPSYPKSSFLNPDFQNHFRSEICNISDLHRRGINLRHLGKVRTEMYKVTQDNDSLYLVEMICRSLKAMISSRWRSLMDDLIIFAEEPFRDEALILFNLIGQPSLAGDFWYVRIKTMITHKYGPGALRQEEMDPNVMLLTQVRPEHRQYLATRLAWHLNVRFDQNIWSNYQDALSNQEEFQFFPQDIKEIKPRIKYMTILDLALGITLYLQAAGAVDAARNEANLLLLQEAKACLVSAWTRISDCLVTRYFLGKVWYLMGKLKPHGADDFARALVMIHSTMVEERDRMDLRIDFSKASVLAYVFGREPKRFEQAQVHYREVSKTNKALALTLRNDVLSWISHQRDNKTVSDEMFAERAANTERVMTLLLYDQEELDEFMTNLKEIVSRSRELGNSKSSRSYMPNTEGRMFTSSVQTSTSPK